MTNIKKFLTIDHDSDHGYGYGYNNSNGCGYSNGDGYGYGYGSSNGHGYSNGDGYGDGSNSDGYGYGSGSGYGYDNGDGNGYGYGSENITSFNGQTVYMIDDIPTIITSTKNNLAKGFILNTDLTTIPCYIAKCGYLFAHGETLKKAREALQDKLFDNLSEEERIDAFLAEFNTTDKYPAEMFYEWHHTLTLSCEAGRQSFIRNHGIDLNNDSFTVREFCELCKNDYGGNIIKKILRKIN